MTNKLRRDLIIGAVVFAGSVYLVHASLGLPKSSAIFPQMVLGAIMFMDIIMVIQSYLKEKDRRDPPADPAAKRNVMPYAIFGFVLGFIALFRLTNYFVAMAALLVGLMLYFKVRSWKLLVGVPVVYGIFVYVLFVMQFKLPII